MEKLTVASVLWKGTFRARKYNHTSYTKKWVKKLAKMVRRNIPENVDYEFVCLTNDKFDISGIRRIPLQYPWQGWWAKMELFRPDLPVSNLVLYLDLDMILVDNIMPFVTDEYSMMICPAFGKQKKLNPRGYNSSVMSFYKSETTRDIWRKFQQNTRFHLKKFRSDQDFIIANFPYLHKYPEKWVRKLIHCLDGDKVVFPKDMKILLSMPVKNDRAIQIYPELRELWG